MHATNSYLQIHPSDNAIVALQDLSKGSQVKVNGDTFTLLDNVSAKHKFSLKSLNPGDNIYMYGVLVGKANEVIPQGAAITTRNIHHATSDFRLGERKLQWQMPDVSKWKNKTFMGYHRPDGSVGTANHWIVIPLVFCENRNIEVLKEALVENLGYSKPKAYQASVAGLIEMYKSGGSHDELLNADLDSVYTEKNTQKVFPNVDGIKFLSHSMGCGGTRSDAQTLCGLLAGYITHPNVAGATVLSLGCQNAQASLLLEEIKKRDSNFRKPLIVLEQQKEGTEKQLINKAIKETFLGLVEANKLERQPAPLSKLCVGLECGGSDGFSGISANPALGAFSDRLVALGGSVILSEFPELCGVEQELGDRCVDEKAALRFMDLMRSYSDRAEQAGSGFYANP